jgi:hypothetical protein
MVAHVWALNPGPPQREAEVVATWQWHWMVHCQISRGEWIISLFSDAFRYATE